MDIQDTETTIPTTNPDSGKGTHTFLKISIDKSNVTDIWLHKTMSQERFFYFTDPCVSDPCKNGGTCISDPYSGSFKCQCTAGWFGYTCYIRGITLLHKKENKYSVT